MYGAVLPPVYILPLSGSQQGQFDHQQYETVARTRTYNCNLQESGKTMKLLVSIKNLNKTVFTKIIFGYKIL